MTVKRMDNVGIVDSDRTKQKDGGFLLMKTLAFITLICLLPSFVAAQETYPMEFYLDSLEAYVGLTLDEFRQIFGDPVQTEVQAEGIPEREALLWFYEIELADSNVVQWRVASQYDRVIGIQIVPTSNEEELIERTLQFIKEGGTTIGSSSSSATRPSYVTRRGDLIWMFGWAGVGAMEFARIRIGTVKYSTCDLIWDTEQLRGTDGFGNPIPPK